MWPAASLPARRTQYLLADIDEFLEHEIWCLKDSKPYVRPAPARPTTEAARESFFEAMYEDGVAFNDIKDRFHELQEVKAVLLANSVHISQRSEEEALRRRDRALECLYDAFAGGKLVGKADVELFVGQRPELENAMMHDLLQFAEELDRSRATFEQFAAWYARIRRDWIYAFM